jgi:hypothetical protein
VISTRIPLEREDLLAATIYAVQVPDTRTKLTIAGIDTGNQPSSALEELLGSVASGLEAKMIGQLGPQLPPGTSKYSLFDAFVRRRLGVDASDGIRALTRIAAMMTERISFSLSVRELDRLSDREGVSGVLLSSLQTANLLARRGDRVSFSHEMFLNVFAAEGIIRRVGDDPDAVVSALRLPQHLEMKPFTLGAIDDDSFRRKVLSGIADARVIQACLAGQCGTDAQRWANGRCDDVLARVANEIETVRFVPPEDDFWYLETEPGTVQTWTVQDLGVLAAIPHELVAGRRLDQVLLLVRKMDGRFEDEFRRLSAVRPVRKKTLRSGLYATCFAGFGTEELGLSRICRSIWSGHLYSGPKLAAVCDIPRRLQSEKLTPSEIGFLVELHKYADYGGPSIGPALSRILDRYWANAPHHLQLALMHAAGLCGRSLTEEERAALIAAVQRLLPSIGGVDLVGVIDALKFLGALDDDQAEHVETAKEEIRVTLADRDNSLLWGRAAGLWNSQFDHPYDGAYCEAWSELPTDDRKAVLLMAAKSTDRHSMFTPSLIGELASFGDPGVGPVIAQWTELPPRREVMAGEAIRSFEMAHAALARLRCPLPSPTEEAPSAAAEALRACGEILYWLNRDELRTSERRANCIRTLQVLLNHEASASAAVLGEFFRSDALFSESAKRLPGSEPVVTAFGQYFPDEVASIYRAALENPNKQSGTLTSFGSRT